LLIVFANFQNSQPTITGHFWQLAQKSSRAGTRLAGGGGCNSFLK